MLSNYSQPDSDLDVFTHVTYVVALPVICAIGLAGNILCIFVLASKKFVGDAAYVYIRAIAWADTGYLIFTLQVCYFVDNYGYMHVNGYRESTSKALEVYTNNFMGPTLNAFGTASDLLIVFMTVDRVDVLKNIGRQDGGMTSRKVWIIRFEVAVIACFCILCHIPMTFQYQVMTCEDALQELASNGTNGTFNDKEVGECWTCIKAPLTERSLWRAYIVIIMLLLRVLPTVFILFVNIWIHQQLKEIIQKRRVLKRLSRRTRIMKKRRKRKERTKVDTSESKSLETLSAKVSSVAEDSDDANEDKDKDDIDDDPVSFTASVMEAMTSVIETEESIDNGSVSKITGGWKKLHKRKWNPKKWMVKALMSGMSSLEMKTSRLVLVIALSHFLLATPANGMFVVWSLDQERWLHLNNSTIWACVGHVLLVLNYSINFLLYCIGNANIRRETFMWIFKCKNIYRGDSQQNCRK